MADAEPLDDAQVCPDDTCIGFLGADGRCKECGKDGNEITRAVELAVETCALCSVVVAPGAGTLANGRRLCDACTAEIARDLEAQNRSSGRLVPAILLGLCGALVGALAWAGIAIATDFEVGYVAVLVGYLAGHGVKLGAGRARGPVLRGIAIAWAVVGLLLAKYFIVVYALVGEVRKMGVELSYFDTRLVRVFWKVLPDVVTPFDALWVILAVAAAARQLKPIQVSLTK